MVWVSGQPLHMPIFSWEQKLVLKLKKLPKKWEVMELNKIHPSIKLTLNHTNPTNKNVDIRFSCPN